MRRKAKKEKARQKKMAARKRLMFDRRESSCASERNDDNASSDESCGISSSVPENVKKSTKRRAQELDTIQRACLTPTPVRRSSRSVSKFVYTESTDEDSPVETPHFLRDRTKQKLVMMKDNIEDDQDDSFSETSSRTDDDDDDDNHEMSFQKGSRSPKLSHKTHTRTASLQTKAEDYFRAHDCLTTTSNNTLARLKVPDLDLKTLEDSLQNVFLSHENCCKSLMTNHKNNFPKWLFQMTQGFNLLMHGLGSKFPLLEEFRQFLAELDYSVIVVNGFFPAISVKQILESITDEILDHRGNLTRPEDQVKYISKTLPDSEAGELFIVIHNIDGIMLRNDKTQNVICNLAGISGIHFVASIDHINAPLLWDQAKLTSLNWIWYDVTTFQPYVHETSYENSILVQRTGALALSSVMHVFKSLTPNAQRIFLLLAKFQLNRGDGTNYIGMPFQDYFHKCREEFLVHSEVTLKTQLTEFKDHKLIRVKKVDGGEYLHILLDPVTLAKFVEQQTDH